MSEIKDRKKVIKTLDDIVFDTRNKEYGCYYLRRSYPRRLLISVSWAFSVFTIAILLYFFIEIHPWNRRFNRNDLVQVENISYSQNMATLLSQISAIYDDQPKLVPPTIEIKPGSSEDKETGTERKALPVLELKPIEQKTDSSQKKLVAELLRKHEGLAKKTDAAKIDSIVMMLEKIPEFPGGYSAVLAYFLKNQHYPENALIHGIHGSATVSFIINESGAIEKPSIVKGIDPELDQEAIRLVKAMPHWQPAYYKGKPIASMLVLPVNFTLK